MQYIQTTIRLNALFSSKNASDVTWDIYYVLTQVANISQRYSSEQFYRMLGDKVRKWQFVYKVFFVGVF